MFKGNIMTKKLLPAMIGAAAALVGGMAPAVADVTVFGHIDTSLDYIDANEETTNLNSNTSSIGFKGSEDLGNGLKAIFKIDFQYDTTERNTGKASSKSFTTTTTTPTVTAGGAPGTGVSTSTFTVVSSVSDSSSITDRDQWLGLAGNFGQVRVGTISTLYKSHGAMIDPLYRTSVQARSLGLQSTLHKGAGENGQGRAKMVRVVQKTPFVMTARTGMVCRPVGIIPSRRKHRQIAAAISRGVLVSSTRMVPSWSLLTTSPVMQVVMTLPTRSVVNGPLGLANRWYRYLGQQHAGCGLWSGRRYFWQRSAECQH
jgi:hypothetical protein